MGAAGADRSYTFGYSLPFSASSRYKHGDCVRSPTVLLGGVPVGLRIFPRGHTSTDGTHLSVFNEVRPREDWVETWKITHTVAIRAENALGKRDVEWGGDSNVVFFSNKMRCGGWFDFLPCTCYRELREGGWLFDDDTVRFRVTVTGEGWRPPKRRRQEQEPAAQLWRDIQFPDMEIVTSEGGEGIPCHRAILATRSPVFASMLKSRMKEGSERRLVLRETSDRAVRALLEHIYTGRNSDETLLDIGVLRPLLPLADQYQLPRLVEQCARGLYEIMAPENVCEVLAVLRTHRDHPGVAEHFDAARRAVHKNAAIVDALIESARVGGAARSSDGGEPA